MFASNWQMTAKQCVKQKYHWSIEDETVICLGSILHTAYFTSQLYCIIPLECTRKFLKQSEKYVLCNKYWKNTLSVKYLDIYHVLSNLLPLNQVSIQAFCLSPAKFLSMKPR